MDNQALLEIHHLSAGTADGTILHDVNLEVQPGEVHVLLGPNGAGKSTLGLAVMGSPAYEVTGGSIIFDGEDITGLSADKRAKLGLFLSFQNPLEVPGLSMEAFLRSAVRERTGKPLKLLSFKKELAGAMELLQMDESYAERDLNAGFSGGEKKKAEILQLLLLKPKLAILDETDSGLDVDAVRIVSEGIAQFVADGGTVLVITHSTRLLSALKVDKAHVLVKGSLVADGGPEIVDEVNRDGFGRFIAE